MKLPVRIQTALTAAVLCVLLISPASAGAPEVKPEDGSKHYAAVSRHLELGGLFFSYVDIDGDLDYLAGLGDRLLDLARREKLPVPENLKASGIIGALGLNAIKAAGMSSRGLGPGRYHNRALLYMPDGPRGVMKVFGGKPSPSQIAAFAPADAGMAAQIELTPGALLDTVEQVLQAAGDENLLLQFKAALSFPVPGLSLSLKELAAKLNVRLMVAARIEEGRKIAIPGVPVAFPGLQIMVALDDAEFLMAPLVTLLGESDAAEIEKGEGFTVIRPRASLPGELDYFRPGLYHDHKARRIIVTTHLDMAKNAGRNGLAGSEDFQKATAGLPAEVNGMTYVTPPFVKAFTGFYKEVMRQSAGAGGNPQGVDRMMDALFDLMPVSPVPLAGIYANVPEGLLVVSNLNENHKHTLFQLAVVPVAFLAGAVSGFSQAVPVPVPAAPRRAEDRERPADPAPAGRVVKNNLQQIAFAAQTYFLDNPGEKTVSYGALVKAELLFELDSVAGESYQELTLKREGGEITVKTKGGDVRLQYGAVTE